MKEIDTNKKNIKHSKDSRNSAARKVCIAIRRFFAILGVTLGMTIVCMYARTVKGCEGLIRNVGQGIEHGRISGQYGCQ